MKCIICNKELENGEDTVYIQDYGYLHIDCIKDILEDDNKRKRPIPYNRLIEIVRKIHLWLFLHVEDEKEVYKDIRLTDEENKILGYANFRIKADKADNMITDTTIIDIDDRNNK